MRRAAAIFALGLAACAPSPPPPSKAPPAPVSVAAPDPPTPAPTATSPEPQATPLPPWIERTGNPACSLTTERWTGRRMASLQLRPGGPVFAHVTGGRARVHIPVGAHDHGTLDVGSNGLVLSGVVEREDVTLFAAASFAMNGVVHPDATTDLTWREGFEDGVSVTMETPTGLVVSHPPLTAKRPCADVSLDRGPQLSHPKTAFGREHGDSRLLRAGGTVAVFSDPSRPADVQLVLTENAFPQVFATSGAFSRIGLQMSQVYVAGWVRTTNLGDVWYGSQGRLGGFGRSGIVPRVFKALRTVECPADLPLVAEAVGERATIGHVLAGTRIEIVDESLPFSRVWIVNRDIHPTMSATLFARASDLATCRTAPR